MRSTLYSALFLLLNIYSFGQSRQQSKFYRHEVGFNMGLANYLGEIGGKEKSEQPFIWDMKMQETRWAVGGFYRYKVNDNFSVRADIIHGRIQGADSLSENPGRVGRNLSFRNDLLELSARTELYLYNAKDVGGRGWYNIDFKSYIFAGLGGVFHSPKALYQGEWVDLRPLKTEGVEYKKVIACIPVGLGFFFTYKRKHRFGWEMGWRMTFTDYLDDISTSYLDPAEFGGNTTAIDLSNRSGELTDSQRPSLENYKAGSKRGDMNDRDTYFFTTFSYSFVIHGKNSYYTQYTSFLGGRRSGKQIISIKFR